MASRVMVRPSGRTIESAQRTQRSAGSIRHDQLSGPTTSLSRRRAVRAVM